MSVINVTAFTAKVGTNTVSAAGAVTSTVSPGSATGTGTLILGGVDCGISDIHNHTLEGTDLTSNTEIE